MNVVRAVNHLFLDCEIKSKINKSVKKNAESSSCANLRIFFYRKIIL